MDDGGKSLGTVIFSGRWRRKPLKTVTFRWKMEEATWNSRSYGRGRKAT